MKKQRMIAGFLILLLLLLLYKIKKRRVELYYNKKIQVVVSRYNENLKFLFDERFKNYDIICYDKGVKEPDSGYPDNCTVIKLSNVGRCDHTYLYHIISNYYKLSPVTIFLPASCTINTKIHLMNYVLEEVEKNNDTVLTHRSSVDYAKEFQNFSIDNWQATCIENKSLNPESELLKSPLRPFGKWYEHNFPERKDVPINYVCYAGIFAVSKEDILKNPIEKYKQLISYLDTHSNPEVGHYMERSWGALFYKN